MTEKYTPEEGERAIAAERAAHRQRAADRKAARAKGEVNQTHDERLYGKKLPPWKQKGRGPWDESVKKEKKRGK